MAYATVDTFAIKNNPHVVREIAEAPFLWVKALWICGRYATTRMPLHAANNIMVMS